MLKRVCLEGEEKREGGKFRPFVLWSPGVGSKVALHHSTSDHIATVPPDAKSSSSGRPQRSSNDDDGT
jgi:hypothetical protein